MSTTATPGLARVRVGLESLPLTLALCGAIALFCIFITKNKRRG